MKLSQWLSPLPLLTTAMLPDIGFAASCSASRLGSAFIGVEFVATAGPSSDGEYRYQSINLHCNDDEVTWATWSYPIDLGWHHPDTVHNTLPPAGFHTNHRVFVNACGTRLVGVNERYRGLLDGIDLSLANYPLQDESYEDRFEQPLYLAYGPDMDACPVAVTRTDQYLGSNSDCSQPMVAGGVNAASGNNFYREDDINGADLNFERSYNSLSNNSLSNDNLSNNSHSDSSGALGPNWQHNYEQGLSVQGDNITALRPDGRVVTFTPAGENNWRSDQDPAALIRPLGPDLSGYIYTDHSGIIDHYDHDGTWQATSDGNGNTRSGVYHNARLSRIVDQFDNAIELEYGTDGKLIRVIAPGQRIFSYRYHASGLLASTTRPDGSSRYYHYDDDTRPTNLTRTSNTDGQTLSSWRYDAEHRVEALFQGEDTGTLSANALSYSLNYAPATTQVTNPLGKQTVYHFTDVANSKRVSEVEGLSSDNCVSANRAYAYHPNGLLHSKINSHGVRTLFTYNDRGLVNQRIDAQGLAEQRLVSTTWHTTINKPELIDEGPRQTTYRYDTSGRVLSKTISDTSAHQSEARRWSYSYGDMGRLIRVDGPRTDLDDSWHFAYDPAGHLSRLINPLGHHVTVAARDSSGLPTSIIDGNGVELALGYDRMGRVSSAQSAGQLSAYDYNEAGQLMRITLPGSGAIRYEYDSAGRLITITNSQGHSISYTLDAAGNRRSQTVRDEYGTVVFTSSSAFDELNRLREELDASKQSAMAYTYDAEGNRTQDIEPLGARTSRLYDALNRVRQVTQRDMGIVNLTYDSLDQLSTATDPRGLVTEYDFDGLGNLLRLTSPDTGVTQFAYDSAGNMIRRIDARGVITEFAYDALNRLQSVTYPSDPALVVNYSYDSVADHNHGIGRLTRIEDQSGSTALIYDALGRITSRHIELGLHRYHWSYTYHPSGQLASTTSPSGYEVRFLHDENGQLSAVSSTDANGENDQVLLEQIQWYPFGSIKSWRYGNQVASNFSLDQNYRVRELEAAGLDPIMARHYRYNTLRDIVNIEDDLHYEASQQLQYDPEHRLQTATGVYGNINYRYDEVGNRLTREVDSATGSEFARYHYSSTSNRLLSVDIDGQDRQTESLLTYDANGNLITTNNRTLSYNDTNRMSVVDNGSRQLMTYNALGQRVSVAQANALRHFHYDLWGKLVAESDGNTGELTREYVYAAGQVIAIVDHEFSNADGDAEPEGSDNEQPKQPVLPIDLGHYRAVAAWLVDRIQVFNATERSREPRKARARAKRFFTFTAPFFEFKRDPRCTESICRGAAPSGKGPKKSRRR